MIAATLAVLGILCAAIQLFYALFFFWRINFHPDGMKGAPMHRAAISHFAVVPVSIIICVRNEAANLAGNLPSVLNQNYGDERGEKLFEVVVVNDASSDDSAVVLASLAAQFSNLRIVTIAADEQRDYPGKKFAVSRGVAAANHPHLLMTDADCRPSSKAWITWMAHPFTEGKEIVAGYSPYYKRRGLLNAFIRCETVHTFLQYLTYNMAGFPYMAVGRNLAFKKDLLLQAEKNERWKATASGDDDMLVQLCGTKDNMTVNAHPASWTFSDAKPTVSEWIRQKQRHLSVGKYYRPGIQLLAGVYGLSHTGFWACSLAWLFIKDSDKSGSYLGYLQVAMVFSRAVIWATWSEASDRYASRRLKFFWPLFDFGWMLYNLFFAPYILWKNKQTWK